MTGVAKRAKVAYAAVKARRGRPFDNDDPLLRLVNVGPATRAAFAELGLDSVEALAGQDADELYVRLQALRGIAIDPCLHDVFRAAILEAGTGEGRPWHSFTAERKQRQASGDFGLRAPGPQAWQKRRRDK